MMKKQFYARHESKRQTGEWSKIKGLNIRGASISASQTFDAGYYDDVLVLGLLMESGSIIPQRMKHKNKNWQPYNRKKILGV